MVTIPKYRNWQDFKSRTDILSEKRKGDCFEVFTKLCLETHPKYKTILKNIWLLKNVSAEVHEYLNLPELDEGIDLIAETKEGKYWAIQCKYKSNETKSLTKDEIDSFISLAFVKCKNIDLGLACTNTDRISTKLSGYNLQFCSGDFWRSLDNEFFKILNQHIKDKVVLPEKSSPRKHQRKAIKKAREHFLNDGNSRGKLIMPCGTGKSLTAFWIAEKLKSKTILIAVPSINLVRQTFEVWFKESVAKKKRINWIVVCSDESVKDVEKDDTSVLTQDFGVPVRTNPDYIATWLNKPKKGITVVFTTYKSGKRIATATKKANINFDLGIFDEAHRTVGSKDKLYSHLLYEENININKRVFMTATEKFYQGASKNVATMKDSKVYGRRFEFLSFQKALDSKPPILTNYKIVTVDVYHSEIKELIKKNIFIKPDTGKWDKEVEAEMFSTLIALNKASKRFPIKKVVSFHSSLPRAKAFKENQDIFTKTFVSSKNFQTFYISGRDSSSERQKKLEKFETSKHGLITNVKCLTEGVDVSNIDCVLFADPKKSTIDIVQAVGRGLRLHKDKKLSYVIVPVLLDQKLKAFKDKQEEAYQPILMTLRALASNDYRIIEYFRSVAEGKKPSGGSGPIEITVPDGLDIDANQFIDDVHLKVWSKLAPLSWMPFEEARAFVHTLNLKSDTEWRSYVKGELKNKPTKPMDIPKAPWETYINLGWKDSGDWLGTFYVANRKRPYRLFSDARKYIRNLNLTKEEDWTNYKKGLLKETKGELPKDIPADPSNVYAEEYISLGDFLGTGTVANIKKEFLSFEEARKYARKLKLKTNTEWRSYCNGEISNKPIKPNNIPRNPDATYKRKDYQEKWANWSDFLGSDNIATKDIPFLPFNQARKFVQGLKLDSQIEFKRYCLNILKEFPPKPENIPTQPHVMYLDKGWNGYEDWLGYEKRKFKVDKINIEILKDIYKYFKNNKTTKVSCVGLNEFLNKLKSRPWKDYRGWTEGIPVAVQSRLLLPFVKKAKRDVVFKGKKVKGYFKEDFKKYFSKYLNKNN